MAKHQKSKLESRLDEKIKEINEKQEQYPKGWRQHAQAYRTRAARAERKMLETTSLGDLIK
jgi:hypothetical protein